MIETLLSGVGLGLALIAPIGPQNLFVLSSGFAFGIPRAFAASLATTACDALLVTIGTLGAGALVNSVPGARIALLAFGVAFLTYLAIKGLLSDVPDDMETEGFSGRQLVSRAVGVSLLNPHAVLDTVGVLGAVAAGQDDPAVFALGTVTASLIWFIVLAAAASAIRSRLTRRARAIVERVSAVILLVFAINLAWELVAELARM